MRNVGLRYRALLDKLTQPTDKLLLIDRLPLKQAVYSLSSLFQRGRLSGYNDSDICFGYKM